jgi:hypothetical protein
VQLEGLGQLKTSDDIVSECASCSLRDVISDGVT